MSVSETPDFSTGVAGSDQVDPTLDVPLVLGTHELKGRLVVGTGKYATYELMQECLEASGAEVITVAVVANGWLTPTAATSSTSSISPATPSSPTPPDALGPEDAVRVARLGREILEGLENPGADWVKLEVLGDTRTLLPDPVATLEATGQLVDEGFQVLCYTSDDPISAKRLKEAGATSVMPAGARSAAARACSTPTTSASVSSTSRKSPGTTR
ncbi:MAG: hypothetical protein Ct9H300mP1_11910 [Planctomycetaceae bacterium]|nr:MAG: hypothetical protein Ct9H300mP1_11910 [Planctomycetaceae bacterium]